MKTSLRDHRTDADFGPLFTGELLRDEGIANVTEHNEKWMDLCVMKMEQSKWLGDGTFIGEDVRHYCEYSVGCANHPNAYGALINTLLKRKIIKPTGQYRKMKDDRSHARRTPVYSK